MSVVSQNSRLCHADLLTAVLRFWCVGCKELPAEYHSNIYIIIHNSFPHLIKQEALSLLLINKERTQEVEN